ncbi:RluA family pseudouridine synthase [Porphyromonas circumdentaria]|uniref:Pseudouridine synthase n=1 Tax=Porphyromonas circumdentaria TaxID=29524 RepID=A0A1T4NV65_9PORP|nr:RluA family pseudouridine synthase [Porphyromonas circumdentaria]MBB6276216.1 23S rRNA pseudouridine1911/1915/1917 synthase [Porphyromonas circumdentaria]SJZ83240.1 23S rRNA pseudouridine1911/1915/1917 synthase [Porphyromonas circumdentaria]
MREDYTEEIWDEEEGFDLSPLPEEEAGANLYEHFRIVVDQGQTPIRVDKFLGDRLEHSSRNRIQQAAEAGHLFAGDTPIKSSYRVRPGDIITLRLERPPFEKGILPEDIPLDIVYEDDDLLVVNKPAGMVVHPGNGNYTGTLVNALAFYLKDNPTYDPNDPAVGLAHRIDKDTSGLLVVAKRPDAKTALGKQFFEKTSERTYYALVWGSFPEKEGRIEGNIGRDPRDRTRMLVFPPDSGEGKPAVTHYKVLETFAFVSLIECRLETGRTHQIRAHMKSINHPLFSDEKYGGHEILRGRPTSAYLSFARRMLQLCPRQALHARTLGFVHPTTKEMIRFEVSLPEDMQLLIEEWRKYALSIL